MNTRMILSPLLLLATITLTAFTPSIQARDTHKMERFTEPYDETVPAAFTCVGEDVHIFGDLEIMVQTSTEPNGRVHAVFHITPHLSVTGVTSGLAYRTAGPLQTVTNTSPTNQSEFHLNNKIVLISPGSNDNLVLHENMKVTVNANGVSTVDFDNFTADCRG